MGNFVMSALATMLMLAIGGGIGFFMGTWYAKAAMFERSMEIRVENEPIMTETVTEE